MNNIDGKRLKNVEPKYILHILIENTGLEDLIMGGEVPPYEWIAIDNSTNFMPGSTEYMASQLLEDMYLEYVEYKNLGSIFRVIRNSNYKMENFN
jgi:hypothetical protein